MTDQRGKTRADSKRLSLDNAAGPARAITESQKAQMIAIALASAGFAPEEDLELGKSNAVVRALPRPARGFRLLPRQMAVGAVLLLATGGGIAAAGLGLVRVIERYVDRTSAVAAHAPRRASSIEVTRLPSEPAEPQTAPAPAEPPAKQATVNEPRAVPDFLGGANALRRQGRWREAARAYGKAARGGPRSESAYVATVALATLEAEHFHHPSVALRLYQEALKAKPAGMLSAEVQVGIASCYRQLRKPHAERLALQKLIDSFPTNLAVPQARARLEQLP